VKKTPVCKRGHDTRVVGRYKSGGCKACVDCRRKRPDVVAQKNLWQERYRISPAGKAVMRRADLKRKYGITPEVYDRKLVEQDGKCEICRGRNPAKGLRLVVDHDHRVGTARDLLCDRCNHLLGNANESVDILQSAIDYIKKWAVAA
jgi:Recombination endonuclease VII